ncbi:aminodeoxychorismate/anthranilate synthase component II [Alteromonas oceanisediminis]|uniref:aminodeoxychorismate/anthranilate synthase component II n=1 Tax=Alteromonas oceanisediminis TaxID=2836180 RepID=UPI001BDAEEE2|nr:aminodeoxychorismate/anthranilate synthase component II [Alteromonas oceanisediminis]MBT0588059.1 aminodeoxychorismate/anthranilate synthase component II [Alteromonas oceanisediminis]
MKTCVFLLDNIDSFSYNLVDELRTLAFDVQIFRNTVDADYIVAQMEHQSAVSPVVLVLSPGPGNPASAGCMPALLAKVKGRFPVVGICLGHQAIVEHYGGVIERAGEVVHGKSSAIEHCGDRMFAHVSQPLPVARYHSLIGNNMPVELEVTATVNNMAMAVYHAADKMIGFQFHPESILTAQGSQLLLQAVQFLIAPKDTNQD